jgi:hypothetical protein
MASKRYAAAGMESEFQPGSRGRVLRNLLGITRMREMLMASQAGLPAVDLRALAGGGKRKYVLAIDAAMSRDYVPLEALFASAIERAQRRASSSI